MIPHMSSVAAILAVAMVAVGAQPADHYPLELRQTTTTGTTATTGTTGTTAAATSGSSLGSLLLSALTAILIAFTGNIGSAVTNAFTATMAGSRLEVIPVDVLMDATSGPRRDLVSDYPPVRRRRHRPQ